MAGQNNTKSCDVNSNRAQHATMQMQHQHVVAIPYPAQGHINPMLQLCQQLLPFGFSFTFINTHHIHQRVQRARAASPAFDARHDTRCIDAHEGQDAHGHVELQAHDAHHNGKAHPHTPHACHADDAFIPHACQDEDNRSLNEDALGDDTRASSSIRMVFVAGGQPPELHAHHSSWCEVYNAAQEMQESVEELILHIMQEQGVAFVLSDIMLRWCGTTAQKFSLPWVCFWPASAATCSLFFYLSDLAAEDKGITFAENEVPGDDAVVEGIPGLPPTHLYDLPDVWDRRTWKPQHVVLGSFAAAAAKGAACKLLLNTFEELEGQAVEALRNRLPTVAVGPLLPAHHLFHTCPDTKQEPPLSLFPEDSRCLAWLDTQPPSSVLFISFGSISLRSQQQLQELAHGVQASGCPFLWVLRPGVSIGFTPDECPDTNPRGLTVSWPPQLKVLSHPSVGGFITHCGWNSIIESVSMGVPMLCWADTGERMSNQRFVVEFWKCGVDMVADSKWAMQHIEGATLVGRDAVEKSVRFLMLEDAGAPVRARAAQLKTIAMRAFQESQMHLEEFVQAMVQK